MPVFKRSQQDSLTGLPTRDVFVSKANKLLMRSNPNDYAAVYMRLVNLGMYIVRHGRNAGEEVVLLIASKLSESPAIEAVGRLSSGSFAALAPIDRVEEVLSAINHLLPTFGETDGLMLKGGYCAMSGNLTLDEAMARALCV